MTHYFVHVLYGVWCFVFDNTLHFCICVFNPSVLHISYSKLFLCCSSCKFEDFCWLLFAMNQIIKIIFVIPPLNILWVWLRTFTLEISMVNPACFSLVPLYIVKVFITAYFFHLGWFNVTLNVRLYLNPVWTWQFLLHFSEHGLNTSPIHGDIYSIRLEITLHEFIFRSCDNFRHG